MPATSHTVLTRRTMPASPLLAYQGLLDAGDILPDPEQLVAVRALDELWHAIQAPAGRGLWRRFSRAAPRPVTGLYLWGGVGRGKTWLMDLFYASLESVPRQRLHFHRFMQRVHTALKQLGQVRDPLPRLAARWAGEYQLLCLDEFFVTDIADAMLLGGMLEALFEHGVTLVTTSNIAPDDLYRDGLQRAKFMPAIDLIKRHCRVMEIGGETDFRLRILEQSAVFHCPADAAAETALDSAFRRISGGFELPSELLINDRPFQARRRGDGVIWFDFDELCEKPRGSVDFIEIARAFNTVLLGKVPQMGEADSNAARRFIILVDEFYDRNVRLLLSTDVPVDSLYTGNRLAFEFQRTVSRLTEMQTREYLHRAHRP